jgi:hypothetical protein
VLDDQSSVPDVSAKALKIEGFGRVRVMNEAGVQCRGEDAGSISLGEVSDRTVGEVKTWVVEFGSVDLYVTRRGVVEASTREERYWVKKPLRMLC